MSTEPRPPLCPPHDPKPRPARFAVPPGACDCHAHVFGPGGRYPFTPHSLYTPADALPADYRHMLAAIGMQRGVLVQPSTASQTSAVQESSSAHAASSAT